MTIPIEYFLKKEFFDGNMKLKNKTLSSETKKFTMEM